MTLHLLLFFWGKFAGAVNFLGPVNGEAVGKEDLAARDGGRRIIVWVGDKCSRLLPEHKTQDIKLGWHQLVYKLGKVSPTLASSALSPTLAMLFFFSEPQ